MENTLLLDFFKTMNNEYRLQMAGLLMMGRLTLAELAERLHLKPADVLNHLAALRLLDLVTVQQHSGQTTYQFNRKALYALSHAVLYRENITPVDDFPNLTVGDTLRNFFEGDRLTIIPESPVKLGMLLSWLITLFEMERQYTEAEVNAIISRHHEDFATLRRGLIDFQWMQRDKGLYWRVK